jgi:hypothetical protein
MASNLDGRGQARVGRVGQATRRTHRRIALVMTAPTDSPTAPAWLTCQAADGYCGIRIGGSGACPARLDESQLADWLATLEPGSDLDLREDDRLVRFGGILF